MAWDMMVRVSGIPGNLMAGNSYLPIDERGQPIFCAILPPPFPPSPPGLSSHVRTYTTSPLRHTINTHHKLGRAQREAVPLWMNGIYRLRRTVEAQSLAALERPTDRFLSLLTSKIRPFLAQ